MYVWEMRKGKARWRTISTDVGIAYVGEVARAGAAKELFASEL